MSFEKVTDGQTLQAQQAAQLSQYRDCVNIDQLKWPTINPYRYSQDIFKIALGNTISTSTTNTEQDMQTPRNAYEFWIIDEDDDWDQQIIVADTAERARDLLIAEYLHAKTVRDLEIVLVRTMALKPKKD